LSGLVRDVAGRILLLADRRHRYTSAMVISRVTVSEMVLQRRCHANLAQMRHRLRQTQRSNHHSMN